MSNCAAKTMEWQSLKHDTFGDSPELADSLLALILAGTKTASCWAAREGDKQVGALEVVCDGRGVPRCVLETLELRLLPFDQVDAAFARDEGEGDLTLEWWRDAHRRFFERNGGWTPDMPLWCERFRVVHVIADNER